jgi:lysine-specific demethylase/histidyl-hydroxylase NO66
LVRDGVVLDAGSYTRSARTGRTRFHDLIDPARVLDQFADGATVVLQSLQRWWPPLAHFCRELEFALGHPLQANAYLTPGGAAGLAPHHDTHDVFVAQVEGSKHWVVREPAIEAPLSRHTSDHGAASGRPVLLEAELSAGDVLYLPRGFVHSATAQQGVSLHLTLGVLVTTVHDVLRRLVDATADEPEFRRALPPGYAVDPDATVGAVKAAVADLIGWLERLDPVPLAGELRRTFSHSRRPLLEGMLLELTRLDAIDDTTAVTLRPGTLLEIEEDGDVLYVHTGDRRLQMPIRLEPAVRRLTDGSVRRVSDLADLMDASSRAVLVRRLVREGVLSSVVDG